MTAAVSREDPRVIEIALHRPAKLYKYTSLDGERREWTRNLIVDSALFFARPSNFNDPLDCRIPPSFDGIPEDIERFWRERWERNGGPAPGREERLPEVIAMSGTEQGRQRLTEMYYELIDTYGIACLNARPDSFLMWSYYAGSHSGVVVRFDTGDEFLRQIPQPCLPLRVRYAKEFPRVSVYERDRFTLIEKTLGTKSEAWQHEEEWRFIAIGRSGLTTMPRGMINGVILGLRTPPAVEDELRGWITEAGRDIEVMRVRHKPRSFELEVVPA